MEFPTIPEELDDWKPEILNELIKYLDIESETFEFKQGANDLETHISAMANTNGGFLILGIEEVRNQGSSKIIEFRKVGFKIGEQDFIQRSIGNSIFNIEPNPSVKIKNLEEGDSFFTVIKIENEFSKKPFMLKNKGQFYVRIANSSRPATRSVISNLFSAPMELRRNVDKIRVASMMLKESLLHFAEDVSVLHPANSTRISPVDSSFMKEAILSTEWFLRENDLLGHHTGQFSSTIGMNSLIHDLTLMNSYAEGYNTESNTERKRDLVHQLDPWRPTSPKLTASIKMLDDIIAKAQDFLSKYN